MSSARILILTNGPLARNPRVVKEASTLREAGYNVTVLGVANHATSVPLDNALAADTPFTHRVINLIAGPRAWTLRAQVRLARDFAHRLRLPSIHALGPARALLSEARAHRADLVIVHNEIAHWAGVRLLAEGRRVAVDFEDWHSEDLLPADRADRPLALLRSVEHTLLHRAAAVTTTSEALADALHARHGGRPPAVITNSFRLQPNPRTLQPVDSAEPPVFFWFSQTTGPGRGLEQFLAAWSRINRPSRVVFLGEVRGGYDRHLLGSVPESLRPYLSFRPLVPPSDLPGVIARHDIGLALEDSSIVNRDLTITNKILQYLNAGLAVIASDTAGQREVLARGPSAGSLVPLHDTNAFASVLNGFLADPIALRTRQAAARRLAEDHYCWEKEAPHLLEHVARALA
ncbi:MAG TPA: glycosyltransferase [Rariglobus sp.]|nr:glycosyltransferase [Rariglobus sp.]